MLVLIEIATPPSVTRNDRNICWHCVIARDKVPKQSHVKLLFLTFGYCKKINKIMIL